MNIELIKAIDESGLKKKHIAKKVGIRRDRLSLIIHEHIVPKPDEMKPMAKLLKKTVGDLFPSLETKGGK